MISLSKSSQNDQRGFILIGVIALMLFLSVIAVAMNRNAGLNLKIATNRALIDRNYFGEASCIEEALWQLTRDPDWRPGRYTDLTLIKGAGVNSQIITASGDFEADGFRPGQKIAVIEAGMDGAVEEDPVDILAVSGNTIQTPPGTLKNRTGSALIQRLSSSPSTHLVALYSETGCANGAIVALAEDFSAHGLKKGDQVLVIAPALHGLFFIVNDVSQTPGRIEVPPGALAKTVDNAWATIARADAHRFVFEGKNYNRRVWTTHLCDQGLFTGISCTREGRETGLRDLVQLRLGQEFYIADTGNHRIRKANTQAKLISTFAGNSLTSPLADPASLWVDASDNLHFADTGNYKIYKRDIATGALIHTAGTGSGGCSGDGGPGTTAQVNLVYGIAVDPGGNVYLADTRNHRVRRVDAATHVISTFAGTGVGGFSGDGGPATGAQIKLSRGVCADAGGNIYIADTDNNRIRKVDIQTGVITTVAGTGAAGCSGDLEPAANARLNRPRGVTGDGSGNLYLADRDNNRIRKIWYDPHHRMWLIRTVAGNGAQGFSGDGGLADQAALNKPHGMWVDPGGNLYFADRDNHRVRRVDASTGILTTVAGTGAAGYGGDGGAATSAKLNKPTGVCGDALGNLFIADQENSRIRWVDMAGIITTKAGTASRGYGGDGVPATTAMLNKPEDVCLDAAGNLYIADRDNHRIRRVDADGIITTVAGTGSGGYSGDGGAALAAKLNKPTGVQVDGSGNLFIADKDNRRVRKVDGQGAIHTVAGTGGSGYNGDGIPATAATLDRPNGIYVDPDSTLYIAETDANMRVRRVDADTGIITTFAGSGVSGFAGDAAPATLAMVNKPADVFADPDGNIYIADTANNRIRKIHAATGFITLMAGNGAAGYDQDGVEAVFTRINKPEGVWVDPHGHVHLADTGNHRVRRVDADTGIITTSAGSGASGCAGDGGPATQAKLNAPKDVAADSLGNLIIADTGNHVIRKVSKSTGVITTVIGEGSGGYESDDVPAVTTPLYGPMGLCRDGAGNAHLADTENHRVRRVDADGIITTVAGNGDQGYTGDGILATATALNAPRAVHADHAGNIFIADTDNHRIRRVDHPTGVVETVAGTGEGGFSGDPGWAASAQVRKPGGVFVDDAGNLYIADTDNHCVRRVDAQTQIITTVAGTGGSAGFSGDGALATGAKLKKPRGVWVDRYGNIFIADTDNHRIRKVEKETGIIATVAGNGTGGYAGDGGSAVSAALKNPGAVAVDHSGSIFIADTDNNRIRKVDWQTGMIATVAGTGTASYGGDGGDPENAMVNNPGGVWVDRLAPGGGFTRF